MPQQTAQTDDDSDSDALDKIMRDEDAQRDESNPEDRRRGELDEQDDTGMPRPSEDGDVDADMDEPATDRHDTN